MERIDLASLPHAERQRWCNGDLWSPTTVVIAVGTLDGDRWYVSRHQLGGAVHACAYGPDHGEWYARGTARRWMRTVGGDWVLHD